MGRGVLSRGSSPRAPGRLAAEDGDPVGLARGDVRFKHGAAGFHPLAAASL